MSLIQEALKRQQQEYGGGVPKETPPATVFSEPPVAETMPVIAPPAGPAPSLSPTRPPVSPEPSSFPIPPPPPVTGRSSSPWLKIGGIVVVALIVLVVGGLIAKKLVLKTAPTKTVVLPAVQPNLPPPPPAAAVAVPPPEPAAVPAADTQVVDKTEPPPPSLPVEKTPVEKERPAPAQWPVLKLTGILASLKAGEGAARINNQMIFVGGEINEVTLVEIRADGVMLKYGAETKFLKMGGMVY